MKSIIYKPNLKVVTLNKKSLMDNQIFGDYFMIDDKLYGYLIQDTPENKLLNLFKDYHIIFTTNDRCDKDMVIVFGKPGWEIYIFSPCSNEFYGHCRIKKNIWNIFASYNMNEEQQIKVFIDFFKKYFNLNICPHEFMIL